MKQLSDASVAAFDLAEKELTLTFDREWALIFGKRGNPPIDECRIFDDKSLSFEQRQAKIEELRSCKRLKRLQRSQPKREPKKSFSECVTDADTLRMRALGIRLD